MLCTQGVRRNAFSLVLLVLTPEVAPADSETQGSRPATTDTAFCPALGILAPILSFVQALLRYDSCNRHYPSTSSVASPCTQTRAAVTMVQNTLSLVESPTPTSCPSSALHL